MALFSQSETHKFELLPLGGFGWSTSWQQALSFAHHTSAKLGKRHRVYWSPSADAWMVRRAFDLSERR
jgi:hypothetical protein